MMIKGVLSFFAVVLMGSSVFAKQTLHANEYLLPNQSITDFNNILTLYYQGDGNLVMYRWGRAIWASNTWGTKPGRAIMQGDGNFVVYDGYGIARWNSRTNGHPGSYVNLAISMATFIDALSGYYTRTDGNGDELQIVSPSNSVLTYFPK
jgi:hypothetical protein